MSAPSSIENDLSGWREAFPILSRKVYLASHSLGAVPRAAREALLEYYSLWAERGIGAWDGPWWESVLDFCSTIEHLLSAPPGTVVPMQNVTRAMAAVASCLDFRGRRNRVVLTDLEFTTSYPLWRGCERLGAEVVVVPSDDGISVASERLIAALDERTLIAPLGHAYFRSGALCDLAAIAEAAHAVGALVLGDGYQTVGTVPVDVVDLGVDFYVGGCHKWLCGGAGAGYLYVRPDLIAEMVPRLTGWFGLQEPFGYEPGTSAGEMSEGVFRFLCGTPNLPAIYAARAGLKIVGEVGLSAIRSRSFELTAGVIERAQARGFRVKSPAQPERRNGMVCFAFEEDEAAVAVLAERDVVVDYRPGCGIRVSPHFYNTHEEIEALFAALDAVRGEG